jgi:hypothetical protein
MPDFAGQVENFAYRRPVNKTRIMCKKSLDKTSNANKRDLDA